MSKVEPHSIVQLIEQNIYESKYDEVIAHCDSSEPSSQILFLKAKALVGARQLSVAMASVEQAITLEPNNGDFYTLKAQVLMYMGRCKESLESATIAISINPDDIGAYTFKGQALKRLFRDSEATTVFSAGVSVVEETHGRDIKLDLEKAFLARSCGKYDHGIKYSNHVINAAPSYASGYIHLGSNLLYKYIKNKTSDEPVAILNEAISAFDKALSLNPRDSIALYYRGVAAEVSGSTDEALSLYRQSSSITPEYVNSALAIVNIHMSRQEDQSALEYINAFLLQNPLTEEALLIKTKILISSDKLDLAEEAVNHLLEINPENHYFLYRKALIQSTANNFESSLKTCELALATKAGDIDILYHKALTLSALARNFEALETIEFILRLDSFFALAYQAQGYIFAEMTENRQSFQYFYTKIIRPEEQSEEIIDLLRRGESGLAEMWHYNKITGKNSNCIEMQREAEEKIMASNLEEASALLQAAIDQNPNFIVAILKLAEVQQLRGFGEESLANIGKAKLIDLEYAKSLLNHMKLPHVLTIEDMALAAHDYAIRLDGQNPMLYSSKASSMTKFHREEGLAECIETATILMNRTNHSTAAPRQEEYLKHQIDKRCELLQEVHNLMVSADSFGGNISSEEFSYLSSTAHPTMIRFGSARLLDCDGIVIPMPSPRETLH